MPSGVGQRVKDDKNKVRHISDGDMTAKGARCGRCRKSLSLFVQEALEDQEYIRGCSSMVEPQPSKLMTWVRFPSPAPALDACGG
jgi:bacterioferritin-associated ferredoxin